MTRTRMTPSAWIEANGLKPQWARESVAFSRWWEESAGNQDRREELLQLGRRWFESGTSPGLESLLRANEGFRREIAQVVLRDVVGEDPAVGRWRGEDGYVFTWNGLVWEREGVASVELRGIETLPHATAACAVRGCAQTRCRDALQRMRSLARTPGRHVKRVWA